MFKAMALSAVLAALLAGVTMAQVTPRRIEIDKITCAQLLASRGDERYRLLVYFNGYMNGSQGQKVWDELREGERIDRAEGACKAAPAETVLGVFTTAWRR